MDTSSPLMPTALLARHLDETKIVVLCGRDDDATAWADALRQNRCLAIGLDAVVLRQQANGQVAQRHNEIISNLDSHPIAHLINEFDPSGTAVVLAPDPMDASHAGRRRLVGHRQPAWRLFEDKTLTDAIWDAVGIPRPPAVIADTCLCPTALVDQGLGVVTAVQNRSDTPTGHAEGLRWWPPGRQPEVRLEQGCRVKMTPLMAGSSVRLHGMVTSEEIVVFRTMEILTLPRTSDGTFLCCGTAPMPASDPSLDALCERIGTGLRTLLGFRGAFSADGIMTAAGFRPTDLNTRLTSAMEPAQPTVRVQMQAANILARLDLGVRSSTLTELAEEAFVRNAVTVYAAANRVRAGAPRQVSVRWCGTTLRISEHSDAHGSLQIVPSLRGWTLTARFTPEQMPDGSELRPLVLPVLRLSDEVLGTDFQDVCAPAGAGRIPGPRNGSDPFNRSAEARECPLATKDLDTFEQG
jgi:hypothetical protein